MASERTRTRRQAEKPLPEDPDAPKRDANGHFLPGTTPNPGGLTKAHREAREAFLKRLPVGLELIDTWLAGSRPAQGDKPAVEVSEAQQIFALEQLFLRALGKPAKASELPLEKARAPVGDTDTATQLAKVRAILAQHIADLEAIQAADGLSPEQAASLGAVGRNLGAILEAEAVAKEKSGIKGLSLPDLLLEIIRMGGAEAMEKALAEWRKQQQEGAAHG